MGGLLQDLRYALRMLGRAPGFTAVVVLTLALSIGANTAIFSVVHATLLKPLPFHNPASLVAVWDTYLPQYPQLGISPLELEGLQGEARLFAQSAWYRHVPKDLQLMPPGGEATEVHAAFISENLLATLGVTPALGRGFATNEPVSSLLLSHRLWQTQFSSDLKVIGRGVRLNEQDYTVVGVMPAAYQFPDWADLWLPKGPLLADELTNPVRHSLGFIGRLQPGVTTAQVDQRFTALCRRLTAEHPTTSRGFGSLVSGLQDDLTAKQCPVLLLLLGAVALVLLIACANVASLLLARASRRTQEMSVRAALGAGAWRMIRQMLTESLLLAFAGGAAGFLMAAWAIALFAPESTQLNAPVIAFSVAATLFTGVIFGLAPALHAARTDLNATIRPGPSKASRTATTHSSLVVVEFALALVLVAGSGILVKSFLRLMHVDPGFRTQGLLTMRVSIPSSRKPAEFYHRIQEKLQSETGIQAVAAANTLPLVANRAFSIRFNVPGSPLIHPDSLPSAELRIVSPGYLQTLGIPLKAGREFTERDVNDSVVIINETTARRFWPGDDPVGRKFVTGPWGPKPSYSTIIGVAGDVRQFGLDSEPTNDFYFPSLAANFLIIRTTINPDKLANTARQAIHSIDPAIPISDVLSMPQIVQDTSSTRRTTMGLLTAFASLALLLALIGIYGVISWSVTQRTREIGIRMALGAGTRTVQRMILRRALLLCVAGLLLGLVAAATLRPVIRAMVFEVNPGDPFLYAGTSAAMLVVAMAACYFPARRASRVDPQIALRWE
ncbi:ABC transporter permease [Paludibaculum fermentans]|uniref:ABC transporter permease n=1 Tax=Paludibaculum fermentans TaxID=1473598 RepID=UPI003EBCEA30